LSAPKAAIPGREIHINAGEQANAKNDEAGGEGEKQISMHGKCTENWKY
jgi:hypothetical protein